MNDELSQKKPFHESIVDAIKCCSVGEVTCLVALIKTTKIPKNHDAIISAWEKRIKELGMENTRGVPLSLLQQQEEAKKTTQVFISEKPTSFIKRLLLKV